MMKDGGFVAQLRAMLVVFLGDWPSRASSVMVPMIGAAGTTFILVSILAIANGIADVMFRAGADDVAIVIQRDAQLETSSRLSDEEVAAIATTMNDAALESEGRARAISAELVQTVDTLSRGGEAGAQVLARGLTVSGVRLRKQFRIAEGRMFTPGRFEVIVGRRLARDFAGLSLGTTLTGSAYEWSIVGVFEDGGSTAESEVWMDLDTARNESGTRADASSVRVNLWSKTDLPALRRALDRSPQLRLQAAAERDYQTRQFSQAIERVRMLAIGLALLLGVGAVVATVNTMSAAVAARERSVATLRAMGFSSVSAAVALFLEAMLLGLIGGVLGAVAAVFVADGYGLSVLNGATSTPVALSASVTLASVTQGIALGVFLSSVAAILPCATVARMSVLSALNPR